MRNKVRCKLRSAEEPAITYHFELRLIGPEARGARLDAGVLRDLLDLLVEGARGALRLRVEGRSQAPGTPPTWLEQAARFDLVGLGTGSTTLAVESKPIAEAAPERFSQLPLFHDFDPSCSAFHLLAQSLEEALSARGDSELFDQALLRRFQGLGRTLSSGLDRLEVRENGKCQTAVDAGRLLGIERLLNQTPPPQRVRVAGRLETIRHSDRMFVIELGDGTTVKGVAEGFEPKQLAGHFGETVAVEGLAIFRPSGRLLRLEAEAVDSAVPAEIDLWSRAPRPTFAPFDERALSQPQGPRTGINALIGQWPGDESEEQFLAALADIS